MHRKPGGLYNLKNELISTWGELIENEVVKIKNDGRYLVNFQCHDRSLKLVIPNSVIDIQDDAFKYVKLSTIIMPETIENISNNLFDEFQLEEIIIHPDNPYFSSENGVLFNKDKTELIRYPITKQDDEYTIPDSVKILKDSCFYSNDCIRKISMKNVEKIEAYAFQDSLSLKEIDLGKKLEYLGFACISYIEDIEKIILPNTLKEIEESVLNECWGLKEIVYLGTEKQYEKIKGIENLDFIKLDKYCKLTFCKTLENLIAEGCSLQAANKILKEYENNR